MKLFHHPMSSNARRANMTALHLGVPLERVVVDLARGEQRQPAFRAINPSGKVPVLVDGDFVLTESHAIMQYLADLTPGQTVYPSAPRARADVNRWLFWSAHHFMPAVSILNWERFVKALSGQGAPDPARVAQGEALVTDLAGHLEAHLAGKEWIAQGQLTLADLAIASPLMSMVPAKLPIGPQHANLHSWFARVRALDAWKQTEV